MRRQRVDQPVPIKRHVDGADEKVKAASQFLDSGRIPAGDDMVGSKALRLVKLAFTGGECSYITSISMAKLHSHVTEAAYADNANTVCRLGMHSQRRKDRDASAEQGPCVG